MKQENVDEVKAKQTQIKEWRKTGQLTKRDVLIEYDTGLFTPVAVFSPQGDKIAIADAYVLRIILLNKKGILTKQDAFAYYNAGVGIKTIDFSPQGDKILIGGYGYMLKVISLTDKYGKWKSGELTEEDVLIQYRANDLINEARFSPAGDKIVFGCSDEFVRVVSLVNQKHKLTEHNVELEYKTNSAVLSVDFSPQGDKIVIGSRDNTVRIISATEQDRNGKPKILAEYISSAFHKYSDITNIYAVSFSPNGDKIAIGGSDNIARIISLSETGIDSGQKAFAEYYNSSGPVYSVNFSPQGDKIVIGDYGHILKIISLKNENGIDKYGQLTDSDILAQYYSSERPAFLVRFSPQGDKILVSYNSLVRLLG